MYLSIFFLILIIFAYYMYFKHCQSKVFLLEKLMVASSVKRPKPKPYVFRFDIRDFNLTVIKTKITQKIKNFKYQNRKIWWNGGVPNIPSSKDQPI